MKKNIFRQICVLALSLTLIMSVSVPVNAATLPDNTSSAVSGEETVIFTGSGTAENPYQIGTASELKALAQKINAGDATFNKAHYKLTASIDLEGSAENPWTPIGTVTNKFMGTFDGTGYTISNLYINNADLEYAGLFGCIGTPAKLSSITVNDAEVTGKKQVGVIAGSAYTGTVENCTVTGKINITGNYKVGGMFGEGYAKLSGCKVQAESGSTVTGVYKETDLEGDNVGGLIGYRGEGSTITTTDCSVSGVTVAGTRKVGGLVGTAFGDHTYTNCSVFNTSLICNAPYDYAKGTFVKGQLAVGGLVGMYSKNGNNGGGKLSSCSVSNIDFSVSDPAVAKEDWPVMGMISGGYRASSISSLSAPDIAITVENIQISGTNTGTTAEQKFPGSVAMNGPQKLFNAGSGTEADPYIISTVDELKLLATTVNETGITYEGQYLKLADGVAELDISGEKWTSIGTSSHKFMGTFDGNGKTITGLTDNGESGVYGLFGAVSGATIKNLKLTDVSLSYVPTYGDSSRGALTGYLYGTNTIDNIEVSGSVSGSDYVGGIVGRPSLSAETDTLTISNCINHAKVTANEKAGGIIGYARADKGQVVIEKCKNTADVTGQYAGGIAGYAWNTTVSTCSNSGDVTGTAVADSGVAGGILGTANSGTNVESSVNTGAVTCDKAAGGIIGSSSSGNNTVSQSANTGAVAGVTNAGGIIGGSSASGDYVDNCYNGGNITATGENAIAGGIYGYNNSSCGVKACLNDGIITAENGGKSYQIGKSGYWYDQATGSKNESCYYITEDKKIYLASGNGDQPPTEQQNMTRAALSETLNTAGGVTDFWQSQNGSVQPDPLIPGALDDQERRAAVILDAEGNEVEAYTSLEAAVTAAKSGQTVSLEKNAQLTAVLPITGNKAITIDLNGNTITGADQAIVIEIGNKETNTDTSVLTLTDSAGTGKVICHETANKAAICVRTGAGMVTKNVTLEFADTVTSNVNAMIQTQGSLILESGTKITSTEAGVTVLGEKGKITINDGVEITGKAYAIAGNGSNGLGGTEIIINGGKMTSSEGAAIYHPQEGTLVLNGGEITGKTGVQLCAGSLNIPKNSSVVVKGTGTDEREGREPGDGLISDGSAISIVDRNYPGGEPQVNIQGGKFTAEQSEAVLAYTWSEDADSEWETAKDFVNIAGGNFSHKVPEDLCADGFKPSQNSDGTFGVQQEGSSGGDIYPSIQKPTIEADEHATVTLNTYGTTATITVEEGYELTDIILNGVSKGKITTVSGLKTGDILKVITQKITTEEDKIARLKQGVQNTTIRAWSSAKKGYIKVNWKKSWGYKVDGYEVFRSIKKNTGYGTKAFFKTTKTRSPGWYKNTKQLKKGTKYYYKVRVYRVLGGEKVYTKWSTKAYRFAK